MMTWQWLAGFFDGEGCVCIRKLNKPKGRLTPAYDLLTHITQRNGKILNEIQDFTGYGVISFRLQPIYRWESRAIDSLKFLKKILPFLKVKKMQARYAIQFQEYRKREDALSQKGLRWREMHRQLIKLHNKSCF